MKNPPPGLIDLSPWIPMFPDDRGSVPPPVEDGSDTAWAEYQACSAALEQRLRELRTASEAQMRRVLHRAAHTRASDSALALEIEVPALGCAAAPASGGSGCGVLTVDEVMRLARQNQRVCPLPAPWRNLYLLLPRHGDAPLLARAPYPIDRRGWQDTSDLNKRLRLREQLDWAEANGALAKVRDFLAGLREREWHHLRELQWPRLEFGGG